ncbi:hypothetical protein MPRG_43480 [Mycobacterium paragordonae]|uniref:Uncharacterized protein n=1 Tax=Mycobacterium paragordonae TaxID=1389713 RepID=A0ABQ1CA30_9MYCO|nr:hypothetical protein MPRG_43480 [Mycobacterium paragordonae]
MDEPRQRQIDLFDFQQVELFTEAAQPDQFLFGESQGCSHAERAPLPSVELDIGARLARPRHGASLSATTAALTLGPVKTRLSCATRVSID